jgi:hypothetical protein
VLATVSNGVAPIGVIDDVKVRAFTNNSWNEVIIVPAVGVRGPSGRLVTPVDIKKELKEAHIIPHSFNSDVDCVLNANNGVITFLKGTPLNYDMTAHGHPDSIRAIVNYTYYIANVPGDDSTAGSNRVSVWWSRFWFQTDQFETNQQYPVNGNLYVSEGGLWTTRKPSNYHPSVALCTAPPIPSNPMIEILFL